MKNGFFLIFLMWLLLLCGSCANKEIVYSSIYPQLDPLESPNVLAVKACHWEYPIVKDDKIFVGLDEENFKCYLTNKEIERQQRVLYEKFITEVNKERKAWNELNKNNSKK